MYHTTNVTRSAMVLAKSTSLTPSQTLESE